MSYGITWHDSPQAAARKYIRAIQTIPDTSAARIFAAADKILRAGHPATSESSEALS